jgi:cyclic beta-1,2-glucan synthetase
MENLRQLFFRTFGNFHTRSWDNFTPPEPPIRSELFSSERLEQHAESLAKAQRVEKQSHRSVKLSRRLDDNALVLRAAYRAVSAAIEAGQPIMPSAEWLLDNFYVVDEQIREVRNDLPPGFYRKLPKLADGPLKGFPRVFGLAWALVAHTDSAFDLQKLTRFVEAYQRVQPLTIGELWAIAITLRITLIENLRRLSEEIIARLSASSSANMLADRILGTDTKGPEPENVVLDLLNNTPWSTTFAVQLAMRLRDRDPDDTPALRWLNNKLTANGTTADDIVREDVHNQGALNVSIRNVVVSMRLIATINWPEFFESVSHVDATLRAGSDFAAMDFQTRDLYRRAIEELAHGCKKNEIQVAQAAVAAAQKVRDAAKGGLPGREADPGYYLVARGRRAFEDQLGCDVATKTKFIRTHSDIGVMSYVALIGLLTILVATLALYAANAATNIAISGWVLAGFTILALIPASDVAVALANRLITHSVGATLLPALELRDGILADMRTAVVVPTLLTSQDSVEEQIERLEVHYLSNPDDNLTFVLLSDWMDSTTEHAPTDQPLFDSAAAGIAHLNKTHPRADNEERFVLLHRRRLWNAGEEKWIGWERKRGKLHELNRLLRGATDTTFLPVNGKAPSMPAGIRYVVTLDADTRMPIGTVKRLVGKIAHPLNKAQYDPVLRRVVAGHGVLQPRVTPSLPIGREGSLYQRVFSGPNGLDPYALAISDVYQDLFEEGSYVGKGIYDADIFEAVMQERIPENAVLSHDLLEGIFTRAGLASDVEVVEEFPSRYDVSAARQHRWVRGDWQLLPWIFGFHHNAQGEREKNAVSAMGRWKLLDNLRRSLSAPAALLAFIMGWLMPFRFGAVWTLFVLITIVLPPLLPAFAGLIPHRVGISFRNHLRSVRSDFTLGLLQSVFLVTFLAHQAWLMTDAILRTLFRLFIRRRKMLEWMTAAQAKQQLGRDTRSLAVQVAASAAFAVFIAGIITFVGYHAWYFATPFTVLWVLSPLAAHWASAPPAEDGHFAIGRERAKELRLIARRTWRFFEKFVTPEDHDLPPDNFQEDPRPVIAHRTSPTNIGLYLVSLISARDFGWLGTSDMLAKLEATFATLQKLERFRGHFFNWYETTDLRALLPKYISTVDSGNLAGHLLALANACDEFGKGPVIQIRWLQAIEDTLALAQESEAARAKLRGASANEALQNAMHEMGILLSKDAPQTPRGMSDFLKSLVQKTAAIAQAAAANATEPLGAEVALWAEAIQATILSHQRDFDFLLPWAGLLPAPDKTSSKDSRDELDALFDSMPTIDNIRHHCETAAQLLEKRSGQEDLIQALETSGHRADIVKQRLAAIAQEAKTLFYDMEFGFLFDENRQLFSIGYREADGSLDSNYYDLLASEARLASFIAIAKGDIPAKHWFRMGRTLTPLSGGSALISWSGSMFEYLMPSLVMRAPGGSLLEQTNKLVVRRQEEYGNELGIPWGMSESQYNARDLEQTYQYSSFGVPDLGYKRGLGENTVIAPYASGLAAMIDPIAAAKNFARMARLGARGDYGWYEALDYTPSRVPEGAKVAIVHAFMSHHQGMALVGIANALHDGAMRQRFHAEPIIQATELLLQERMPRDVAVARPPPQQTAQAKNFGGHDPRVQRRYNDVHSRVPRTHVLSNGNYSAMVTASGSGYSRWRDVAITRWREDVTCDNWGTYIFIRDVRSGDVWSAGYQPAGIEPDSYDVVFSEDRAEVTRNDGAVTTMLEVAVSPEDDAEVRRVSITNRGTRAREIEITSYAEIALARQADDLAHPAFAKLFVETEFVPSLGAILATRRRRSDSDPMVWAAHLSVVEGETLGDVQFETDRLRFLGRGLTVRSPAAISDGWPLSNTAGQVLDPAFSLRRRVRIPRGATVRVAFWTVAAPTRDEVLAIADKHHDAMAFDRATMLAWTQAQMQLHHLGVRFDEANLFQRLANHILYTDPTLRPPSDVLKKGIAKSSTLWANGISGDRPIILVQIDDEGDIDLVRQLLRAHEYWRLKQIAVDLVILNERVSSYVQDLQTALDGLVRMSRSMPDLAGDRSRGRAFVLRADMVSPDVRGVLMACARAVLQGGRGTLAEQINRARDRKPGVASPPRKPLLPVAPESPLPRPAMQFFNGIGGFSSDGREYVTVLDGAQRTPAPWINVIANKQFGFHVSTDGSGFTWSINSQQYQITPWSNDAVGDPPGEILYVRDDDTGEVWGPTALPIREKTSPYTVRHGQGYSRFEHISHGIALELTLFVPTDDPVKIARLKISNQSGRDRRLSITAYVEWVLGQSRGANAPFIVTEIDPETGAIFAQNNWSNSFGGRVAFADMGGKQTAWTGDRTEFLGRDGTLDRPIGLIPGVQFSNRTGAGMDPCAVQQAQIRLSAIGATEIVFFMGETASRADAQALIKKYRGADLNAVLAGATRQWDDILGTVQVKTPDRALDLLLNRWLVYQTLACRVWARSAFYQASGAYGFRDQLQDVMALCIARPDIAREHILRATGRQFAEGDVQHWWLPETGNGIRTRVSDDRGWLAFVVAHYVETTGDASVLDELVPFLDGPVLKTDQHDNFFQPTTSDKKVSVFEHCALALDESMATGAHGLPLMGTGDWNDGMDQVGGGGKGESVWLGWFLHSALTSFAAIADKHGAAGRAAGWRANAAKLREALDTQGWDGDWYRRAYFDDGTPLGSIANSQCRIDNIAQSWSVISGGAEPARATRAMEAVEKFLIKRDEKLALLFTPPFDNPERDPGYIKGYPPGVRENGGQYTHGATWAALAFAMLGDGDKAGEILSLLNPINHSSNRTDIDRYKVEPYVICADIYSVPPHAGRGGWTWYTGSAAWTYRIALEWLLGFRLQGDKLLLDPCIPRGWPSFEISYRRGTTQYDVAVENPLGVSRGIIAVKLDGQSRTGDDRALIPLTEDGGKHRIQIVLG